MKKFNPEKSIGLVLDLDDFYRPSNEKQRLRLVDLWAKALIPSGLLPRTPQFKPHEIADLKTLANSFGYKIFTRGKCFGTPCRKGKWESCLSMWGCSTTDL